MTIHVVKGQAKKNQMSMILKMKTQIIKARRRPQNAAPETDASTLARHPNGHENGRGHMCGKEGLFQ
jgi:hypothetical protein